MYLLESLQMARRVIINPEPRSELIKKEYGRFPGKSSVEICCSIALVRAH